MTTGEVIAITISGLLALVTGVVTARYSARAQNKATDVQSGALALRIANRADRKATHAEKRLDSYDRWRRLVTDVWYPTHLNEYDRPIAAQLLAVNPEAIIPPLRPLPEYQAPPDIESEDDEEPDDRPRP